MPSRARNSRSFLIVPLGLALLLTLLLGAIWWARWRFRFDPLTEGLDAYAHGEWDRAASVARERLRANKDDEPAFRLLARASARLGRDARPDCCTSRSSQTQMTADDHYLVGAMLFRAGNQKESIEAWQRALQADPDHAEALHDLARLYLEMGRLGDAAHAASRLAKLPSWRARGLALLGTIMLAENDAAGAAAALRTALEQKPAAGDHSEPVATRKALARALLRSGRPAEARDELRAFLSQGSDARDDSEAWWLLSRAQLQEGVLPEARESLGKAGGCRRR